MRWCCRSRLQVSKRWEIFPIVTVLAFNIFLELWWPSISWKTHFLLLLAASGILFGASYGIAVFIKVLHTSRDNQ